MATHKTPFSKRCEVLGELWLYYREDADKNEIWKEYFTIYDIGLPLSYMLWQDIVTLNIGGDGQKSIDDAWDSFCSLIAIDPNGHYNSLGDCFDASPNEPVE